MPSSAPHSVATLSSDETKLSKVLWPVALLISLLLLSLRYIGDLDIFYHIANGRTILEQGGVPKTNLFVWTESGSTFYPNPAWLFGAVVALLHEYAGLDGIVVAKTLLVVLVFVMLFRILREAGLGVRLTFSLLWLVAMVSAFRFTERPHLLSLFFLTCFVWLIQRHRRAGGPSVYWLIPLTAAWANIHAGFILGLGYLFLVLGAEIYTFKMRSVLATDRHPRVLGITALASLLASLITPVPLANYRFLLQSFGAGYEFPITEYAAVSFTVAPWFYPFAFLLLVATLLKPRCQDPSVVIPAAVFFLAACWSVRFVPDFAIAALPLAAERCRSLGRTRELHGSRPRWMGGIDILAPLLLIAVVVLMPPVGGKIGLGIQRGEVPSGAFRFFDRHVIRGNLYNSMSHGGTGMFYLYPKYKLYQTSYFQVERERILEAYLANKRPESWRDFLERYRVEAAFVDTTREQHTATYYPELDWALVYFDDTSAIYLRRWGSNQALIEQTEIKVAHPDRFFSAGRPDPLPANVETGITELSRLLALNDESYLVHFMLGCYLFQKGMGDGSAARHLNRAVELNPEFGLAFLWRGLYLRESGDLERAVLDFSRAAELVPSDPRTWNELGVARGMQGRFDEALGAFRRALEIDPGHVEARKNIDRVHRLQAVPQ